MLISNIWKTDSEELCQLRETRHWGLVIIGHQSGLRQGQIRTIFRRYIILNY